jgi:hypothetical protein
MDLVFMLLGCVAGVWVTQKIWDTEQKGIAVIFGFIGVPLCAVIALYIGMSVGLVKSSGGSSYGCYSEGPYGVKCD